VDVVLLELEAADCCELSLLARAAASEALLPVSSNRFR